MGSIDANQSVQEAYPPPHVDVLIIGAGLAGLTAALECHRKGMTVRVLERNSTNNTAGDMFFMGISATRWFKHWPEMQAEYDRISLHNAWIETFKHTGEVMVKAMRVPDRIYTTQLGPKTHPGTFQMRPLIYRMLVNQADRLGIRIKYNQRVTDYYEDSEATRGGVVTEDGAHHEADIVIAADGIGSKAQALVGGQVRAIPSGRAMWRAAFPRVHLDQTPKVKEFFGMVNGEHPIIRTWLGPGGYALTLTKPDLMVWIMNHDATGSEKESWKDTIEADEVLAEIDKGAGPEKWAPTFKELIKRTPAKTIIDFELLWRNPQPSWTSPRARVILIGDAAHSFLPASGNGATQAIEDAISLASCLQKEGKGTFHNLFELTFVRTACAQKLGFVNANLLQNTNWEKVKLNPRKASPMQPRWICDHDPETYAEENYHKVILSTRNDIPWENDETFPPNYPPGYKFEPWSIEQIMDDKRNGRQTALGSGDWS